MDITLSDQAANRIGELLLEEGNPQLNFRVYITGGGCSGFQYGFMFDKNIRPDDEIIEKTIPLTDGNDLSIKLLVDALSLMYLMGGRVHYVEHLQGARFTVDNPNAKTTCSCGSSFSLDTEKD